MHVFTENRPFVAPAFRPSSARIPSARTVACPDCHAEAGKSCTGAAGQDVQSHRSRRRMATRALNNERSAA